MTDSKKSVLFICLGNICRSPIAEAVFLNCLKESGKSSSWTVDSAAIGNWHVGNGPDRRAVSVLSKHGITTCHKARQVKKSDFSKFDYIFGMDHENIEDLKSIEPDQSIAKIGLLGSYDPDGELIIEDPYYESGEAGFEKCYQQCIRCCQAFLDQVN